MGARRFGPGHGQEYPELCERAGRLRRATGPFRRRGGGRLVLDPTCGSGTNAYVAEQWGLCWITIDTSDEIRSDGPEGIACWFIDTDYNEESFFVRHAYFLGANDPYKALRTTLKAEVDPDA